MSLKKIAKPLFLAGLCAPLLAHAEIGIYAKAGTLGLGGGVGYGFNDMFTVRAGYTAFSFDHDVNTTDIDYSGKFKLGGGEALVDWHPFEGTFRITGGVIFSRTKLDVDAKLNNTTVTINDTVYQTSEIGSLSGSVKFRSTAPYLGIGWGNVAGNDGNFHFVADIGIEFLGSPDVKLRGGCTDTFQANNPVECAQLASDIQTEEKSLNNEVKDYKWWPVLNVGLAYRF